MEEIKVGEYVRTDKGSIIKITSSRDIGYLEEEYPGFKKTIIKHNKNIIDLIEIGDVIKYKELTADDKYGTIVNEKYIGDVHTESDLKCVKEEIERKGIELLEILTKETFERESYKVEEE